MVTARRSRLRCRTMVTKGKLTPRRMDATLRMTSCCYFSGATVASSYSASGLPAMAGRSRLMKRLHSDADAAFAGQSLSARCALRVSQGIRVARRPRRRCQMRRRARAYGRSLATAPWGGCRLLPPSGPASTHRRP